VVLEAEAEVEAVEVLGAAEVEDFLEEVVVL